jgi:hypothetical protein
MTELYPRRHTDNMLRSQLLIGHPSMWISNSKSYENIIRLKVYPE